MFLKQFIFIVVAVGSIADAAPKLSKIPSVECSRLLADAEKLRAYASLSPDELNTSDLPNVARVVALKDAGLLTLTESEQIDLVRAINTHREALIWLESLIDYANRVNRFKRKVRNSSLNQTAKLRSEALELVRSTELRVYLDPDVRRLIGFYSVVLSDRELSQNEALLWTLDQFPRYRGFATINPITQSQMKLDYYVRALRTKEFLKANNLKASDRRRLLSYLM